MSFIEEVVNHLLQQDAGKLGECTVIFPNRRAGLFLKKELSKRVNKPIWAPEVLSLEDFLLSQSTIYKTDALSLLFELYLAFQEQQASSEEFDMFYFWGEMLLRDFEEVDHYLVDPKQLFKYIEDDRQLAEDFYFLDEEQETIIKNFWQEFFPKASKSQEHFVETWKLLFPVYQGFKARLLNKGVGYTSHIYRQLHEQIEAGTFSCKKPGRLVFAGFNALTPVEEKLIRYFMVEYNAEILWDIDAYYLKDENQEAGLFLRKYQKDKVLGKLFPQEPSQHIRKEKNVRVTGVTLEIGQAKLVGQEVQSLLKEKQVLPEDIVVILPQEYMLFPVLNALPAEVSKLNVTMGYPLKETPLFGLLDAAIELQERVTKTEEGWLTFYHKPVLDILSHPYLYSQEKDLLDNLITYIKKKNQVRVQDSDIADVGSVLLNVIFREVSEKQYVSYLLGIVESLGEHIQVRFGLEKEFLYQFKLLLERLDEILSSQSIVIDIKTFRSLFQKATRSVKIPFSGEPVEGLQVMGALETRNLDFKYVFMLGMNEDSFPSAQNKSSFIPYRIRKAFDLPTFEVQDAIYAYLFYRLFQKSEELSFFYNMHADFGMSGELSRFLRQLELESGISVQRYKLNNSIKAKDQSVITIEKTDDVLSRLRLYTEGGGRKLSPSAINMYYDCELRFYFRYVLLYTTKDELSDELTPRDFGNILHRVMEILYGDLLDRKPNRMIEESDYFLLDNSVKGAIEKAFKEHFPSKRNQKFQLKGRNLVMADLMNRFVTRTLEMDKAYAPFEMVSLENDKSVHYDRKHTIETNGQRYDVMLKGIIDRVDRKNGQVRVIDYKSGKDSTEMINMEKIFDATPASDYRKGRNKAGFQTMYYAWLYAHARGEEEAITPGIFNIQEIFTPDFDYRLKMGGAPMEDARPYLGDFEKGLEEVLKQIYNQEKPFFQTDDLKKCAYCDYKGFCER